MASAELGTVSPISKNVRATAFELKLFFEQLECLKSVSFSL